MMKRQSESQPEKNAQYVQKNKDKDESRFLRNSKSVKKMWQRL